MGEPGTLRWTSFYVKWTSFYAKWTSFEAEGGCLTLDTGTMYSAAR